MVLRTGELQRSKKGHDFKDYICPDSMEFEKDYFKMGNRYGRVLFLREYASYIKDSMVAELTDLNSGIRINKLRTMTNKENCPFVLWIGSKSLIKRRLLDEDIAKAYSI